MTLFLICIVLKKGLLIINIEQDDKRDNQYEVGEKAESHDAGPQPNTQPLNDPVNPLNWPIGIKV